MRSNPVVFDLPRNPTGRYIELTEIDPRTEVNFQFEWPLHLLTCVRASGHREGETRERDSQDSSRLLYVYVWQCCHHLLEQR